MRMVQRLRFVAQTVAPLMLSLAVTACGGGGATDSVAEVSTLALPVELATSCANCSAVTPNLYSGTGVGIWDAKNTGTSDAEVNVSIDGLTGQDVTLIFTNETGSDATLQPIATASVSAAPSQYHSLVEHQVHSDKEAIEEFNREGWADYVDLSEPRQQVVASGSTPVFSAVPGATRTFNHYDGSVRSTTLKRQQTMADGVVVNLWLEDDEYAPLKVSDTLVDLIQSSFVGSGGTGGIYSAVKEMGGPFWGPHTYSELISPLNQPVDVVLLNLKKDAQPLGVLGYFHALNNFKKTVKPASNESVSIYLDTETLYLYGTQGQEIIQMTLAHEAMHMSNFYRRNVSMGPTYRFDAWLEELTAMVVEDIASAGVTPSYNPIRDMRFPDYLYYGSYNCALMNFTPFAGTCESYAVSGSFGGFLVRQLGVPFFKNLLAQPVQGSATALNNAISTARPGSGIGIELRKFAVAGIAALPASGAPAGFDFPARVDSGYTIPVINAEAAKGSRTLASTSPSVLKAYANFPVVRSNVSGTFSETVRLAPGVSLSVVIN